MDTDMSEPVHIEKCRHCGYEGQQTVTLRTTGVHHADVNCAKCRRHLRFLPKPDSDPTKYRRPQQHRDLVQAYGRDFCEMCLRGIDELPKGQTLEAQHVIEYQEGGSNKRENIWIICTACHRMIHWIRTYHGTVKLQNQATEMMLSHDQVC